MITKIFLAPNGFTVSAISYKWFMQKPDQLGCWLTPVGLIPVDNNRCYSFDAKQKKISTIEGFLHDVNQY